MYILHLPGTLFLFLVVKLAYGSYFFYDLVVVGPTFTDLVRRGTK